MPVATIFIISIYEKVTLKKNVKTAVLIFPIVLALYIHPDYFSYYNPFFGGVRTGINIIEPKWMIGQKEIVEYFEKLVYEKQIPGDTECPSFECIIKEKKNDQVLSIGFPEKYYTQIHPFIREINGWAIIKDLTPFAKHTKYFVYPIWEDDSHLEDRFKLNFIDTIKVRGVNVYNVYESY